MLSELIKKKTKYNQSHYHKQVNVFIQKIVDF